MSDGVVSTRRSWIAHVVAGCIVVLCVVGIVTQVPPSLGDIPFIALMATMLTVGWLIAWKRPRNGLGWLVLAVPALFATQAPIAAVGTTVLASRPDLAAWLLWYGADRDDTWAWAVPVGILLTQIPLRFPDGRLPTPRWRWFWWFTIVTVIFASAVVSTSATEVSPGVANPVHVPGLADAPAMTLLVFGSLILCFIGAVSSMVVRYRRAAEREQAQLRWVLWAASIAAAALVIGWVVPVDSVVWQIVAPLAYALIPVSIGVAVLRFRLYDIDRIISRTAAYAIVTVLVLGVYAVIATSVTWILPKATAVAVAVATLAAAAIFLPALRWIRRRVDRRFDRERFDAQRTVEEFGERLRTGADPHSASTDLADAVTRTLQPSAIGLWQQRGSS